MTCFEKTSDWISIALDSFHDHKSGYVFVVNAAGVQVDAMIYDDSDYDGDWRATDVGDDARITGEIENTGSTRASRVVITVTLRNSGGSLIARKRNHSVGAINAGESELFEVILINAFSEYDVNVNSFKVEVDIED